MNNSLRQGGFPRNSAQFRLPGFKALCVLALCLFMAIAARAASFTASLDRDTIELGENATLSLSFTGGQPQNVPAPEVPGLQFANAGNSSSFSFVNGQMTSSVTVTFNVTPQQAGGFTIPSMTVEIGGQQLSSQPLKLTVSQPAAPSNVQINSGSQVAFMRLNLPTQKVYPGQVVPAQLLFLFRDDVQHFQDIQINSTPADGFAVGKIVGAGASQRTQLGNRTYTVVPASLLLTVSKTGALTVGPFTAGATIVTGAQSLGPFGELFGGDERRITLASDPISVESLPLPTQNVPASFNGTVGDYSMVVTAGPTNLAVGDPITVRVQISGRGDLDALTLPNQPGWNNFKIFSPTSKVQPGDDLGDEGSKTFEEIVTPQDANIRELPAFSFSYFNPDDGSYHTLTQPSMPLTVSAVAATPLPTIAGTRPTPNQNQAPQDIVPIRENLGTLVQTHPPLITHPVFLALQSIPVLAFLSVLVWRKRTDNLANNPRLRRQRAVEQLIASGLGDLNKFASENKSNEFFAMLFRLLQEQLGERLDCPAFSITEADVDERLIALGAKPETLNSLRELFQACNQARYAPIQTSQELSALAAKFKNAVNELQNLKT
jgi:hypothetical protein